MTTFYRPITLKTETYIRTEVMRILQTQWDFESERTIRIPTQGELFDAANAEMISLGYGRIGTWTAFSRGPFNKQFVHCDSTAKGERLHSAVLIPLCGCDNSLMQWFDETHCKMVHIPTMDFKTTLLRDISMKEHQVIEEVRVTTPMIANVGVPHRAVAGDTPRSLLSIKFVGNPCLL